MSRLCKDILQNNQVENKDANDDVTAVFPPKNKEVLFIFDIIRRRLQFKGEKMDTFLQSERKMRDSAQIILSKKQLHSILLETKFN